jgi:hypothetical protein
MNIKGREAAYHAFLQQNAAFWRENTGYPGDDESRLYVDIAHDNPVYLLNNLWIAKYLQKIRGGRLVGLAHGWLQPSPDYKLEIVRELARSFLVDEVVDLDAAPDESTAIRQRFASAVSGLSGTELRRAILSFDADQDPDLGWILVDTWLRQEHVATITTCEPGLLECAYSVFRLRDAIARAMRGGNALGVVIGHHQYSPYTFMAFEAARQNAPVYFQWILVPTSIRRFATVADVRRGRASDFESSYREHFQNRLQPEALARWQRRMFDVQSGTREFFRVLEGGRDVRYRAEFLTRLGLDPQKPVVSLYAPALCAAPHCFGEMAYDDFADWLERSLQIGAELPDINLLVKPHPQDALYDRSRLIDRLKSVYSSAPNIRFLDANVPAEQMVAVCDLAALVSGTPGYEMASRGVATVSAGTSRYSGLGFAIEAFDVDRYRNVLAHAGEQHLSEEQRQRALEFAFFELAAGRCQSLFVPRMKNVGSIEFWNEAELNLRSRYIEEDPLFRGIRHMVEQDLPFLLNTDLVPPPPTPQTQSIPREDSAFRSSHVSTLSVMYALDQRATESERKYAEASQELAQAAALLATLIRQGRSVQFGTGETGNFLLGTGWSTPEPKGIWTDGFSAEILLPWVPGHAVLCLDCYAFAPGFSPVRSVELLCNDVCLDRKDFQSQSSPSTWAVEMESIAQHLRIALRILNPAMPPGDPRQLGLWLTRLWVHPDRKDRPWEPDRP